MLDYLDESDDDPLDFTEEIERSWRVYMKAFVNDVYPVFKDSGITLAEALIIWELNHLKNAISKLEKEDGD